MRFGPEGRTSARPAHRRTPAGPDAAGNPPPWLPAPSQPAKPTVATPPIALNHDTTKAHLNLLARSLASGGRRPRSRPGPAPGGLILLDGACDHPTPRMKVLTSFTPTRHSRSIEMRCGPLLITSDPGTSAPAGPALTDRDVLLSALLCRRLVRRLHPDRRSQWLTPWSRSLPSC